MKEQIMSGTSSIDFPLEFFHSFFQRDGFNLFINQSDISSINNSNQYKIPFFTMEDAIRYTSYDRPKAPINYNSQILVPETIIQKLDEEISKSKYLIGEKIKSLGFDQNKISDFLRLIINDIEFIISIIQRDPRFSGNKGFSFLMYRFVEFLFQRYNLYLPQTQFKVIDDAKRFLGDNFGKTVAEVEKIIPEKKELLSDPIINLKKITGFKWKENIEKNSGVLFSILKKEGAISPETDKKSFENAFNGDEIKEPLRICWIAKSRRGDVKPVIIKVLKLLIEELGYLHKVQVQSDFAKKIEAIFVDSHGVTGNDECSVFGIFRCSNFGIKPYSDFGINNTVFCEQ